MEEAMKFQSNAKYFEALLSWNKALANDMEGKFWNYIYQQRSRIYFRMQHYKQCLNNIRMSEEINVITRRLMERRKHCEAAMGKHGKSFGTSAPREFLNLTHSPNPRLPFMVDSLKVQVNSRRTGYNITTDKPLSVGDVIAIEEPFYNGSFVKDEKDKDIEVDLAYQRCYHCHDDNFMDLIACKKCEDGELNY